MIQMHVLLEISGNAQNMKPILPKPNVPKCHRLAIFYSVSFWIGFYTNMRVYHR